MPEIDLASAIQSNWIKLGTLEMEAVGNRIIVVQDEFHSGTECLRCQCKEIRQIDAMHQASVIDCPDCNGTGQRLVNDVQKKCSGCEGRGWLACPDCKGTGVAEGQLAHPQDREHRPTTGQIVSKGWLVEHYQRGDSVIYGPSSGHFWDLEAIDAKGNYVKVTVGVLREDEVISRVRGHLELRRVHSAQSKWNAD